MSVGWDKTNCCVTIQHTTLVLNSTSSSFLLGILYSTSIIVALATSMILLYCCVVLLYDPSSDSAWGCAAASVKRRFAVLLKVAERQAIMSWPKLPNATTVLIVLIVAIVQ